MKGVVDIMLRCVCLWSMLAVILLCGCTKEYRQQREIKRMEREVSAMVDRIPDALRAIYGAKSFASNLIEKIESLPNVEQRVKWYNCAIDKFFTIDISMLPYSEQYKCIISSSDFRTEFSTAAMKYDHQGYFIWWRRRINSLAWKKRQWDRLRKAYEREKDSINVVPVPNSVLDRVEGLQYIVESGIEGFYYAEMTSNEYSWWSSKDRMTPEERETIQREFEAYLGRPIRTERQIYADSIRRMEARKKREKERAKKAGRVILVDGTK